MEVEVSDKEGSGRTDENYENSGEQTDLNLLRQVDNEMGAKRRFCINRQASPC